MVSVAFGSGTTWTCPSNFQHSTGSAYPYGAGGGGSGSQGGGGGGGGGGYCGYGFDAALNGGYTVAVGAGTGNSIGAGGAGGASTIYVGPYQISGGGGGAPGGNYTYGAGGTGGYPGGHGGSCFVSGQLGAGGGGGGCAGPSGPGNAGASAGGLGNVGGGASQGGYSGAGGTNGYETENGQNGGAYGGGGGGGGADTGLSQNESGGAGIQGLVNITYNTIAGPTISSFNAQGYVNGNDNTSYDTGGDVVYVYGSSFTTATTVNITYVGNVGFAIDSDGQIHFSNPAVGQQAVFDNNITVYNQVGSYAIGGYFYSPNPPQISSINFSQPAGDPDNNWLWQDQSGGFAQYGYIEGAYFTTASAVYVNGVAVSFGIQADYQIIINSFPSFAQQAAFIVNLEVVNGSSGTNYTILYSDIGYSANPPEISSVTFTQPAGMPYNNWTWQDQSGGFAQQCTIGGKYFTTATTVQIYGQNVGFSISSDTQIIVPAGDIPTIGQQAAADFTVTVYNRSAFGGLNLNYAQLVNGCAHAPNPIVLNSISPTIIDEGGGPAWNVTVSGKYLTTHGNPTFGSQPANATALVNDSTLVVQPPSCVVGNEGTQTFTVTNASFGGFNTATATFTWTYYGTPAMHIGFGL